MAATMVPIVARCVIAHSCSHPSRQFHLSRKPQHMAISECCEALLIAAKCMDTPVLSFKQSSSTFKVGTLWQAQPALNLLQTQYLRTSCICKRVSENRSWKGHSPTPIGNDKLLETLLEMHLLVAHDCSTAWMCMQLNAYAQAELTLAAVTDKDKRIADLVQELEIEKVVRR